MNKGKEKTKAKNTDTYDGSGGYASNEDWTKFLATDAGKAYTKKNTKQVGTGEFEPDTVTDIPGETKTKLGDLEVKGRRGAVQRWESNSQARQMKTLSDDISDSKKKIGRYTDRRETHGIYTEGAIGEDGVQAKGTWAAKDGHKRRFRNASANLDESTRNMGASQGQYDTYTRQVAAGAKGSSGDTFGVKTKATGSDLGTSSTTLESQQKLLETGKIGGDSTAETNVAPVPIVGRDGEVVDAKKKKTDVVAPGKMNSKFFKKKSPLKMKYFK